jgi:hypothetical protein
MISPLQVRRFLDAGSNDTNPSRQEWRSKLEPLLQRSMDPFVHGEVFNCSVFRALSKAGWPLGHGRKMRFEIGAQFTGAGETKCVEVASEKELDDLFGDGKTIETLLRAFANVEPTLAQ